MRATYRPKGAALEYGELAVNLYTGCPHACCYCYAPGTLRLRKPAQVAAFHRNVAVRPGVLEQIERDVTRLQQTLPEPKNVILCFCCDPYPRGYDSTPTREAIAAYNDGGFPVTILTKGGELAARDFDLLPMHPENKFGVTLTFDNVTDSFSWEPRAADPLERISTLAQAHNLGIRTWVSMEPVINPDQSLHLIHLVSDVADEIHLGRLNHFAEASSGIDYPGFILQAAATLQAHGFAREHGSAKTYRIKNDLARTAGK